MASYAQARAFLDYYAPRLIEDYPRVVAVSIGRKEIAGERTGQGWCLRIHVARKTKRRSSRSVPRTLPAPPGRKTLGTIETDVIETGETRLDVAVQPGESVRAGERGTVGCALQDPHQQQYLLTAGHVIGRSLVVDATRNGWLDLGAPIPAHVRGATNPVGISVKCSQPDPFVDLGLILMTAAETQASGQIRGARDVNKDRLKASETIRVVRNEGAMLTAYHQGADRDGKVSFPYPDPTGRGTVHPVFDNILFYPRTGVNERTGRPVKLKGGDSGSAVVDANHRLLGIHIGSSYSDEPGAFLLGYAVPVADIRKWAPDLCLMTAEGGQDL